MTISVSTKLRAAGSASVFALAAGLGGVTTAFAAAPAPVQTVPVPATPVAPGNVEQCALITTVTPPEVVCAPGTDPDGFQQPFNSIDLTIDAGSQVQGEINLLVGVDVTNNGSIVISGGVANGIELGADATVVNNGFIGGAAGFSGLILTGAGSDITNNGTIASSANLLAIQAGVGSTVVNNGLIALNGGNTFGIVGQNLIVSGDNVTATNSVTGSIIVQGGMGLSGGIGLGNDATVNNDGLIQTFGANSEGIRVFDRGTVTNTGTVFAIGAGADGIITGIDSTVVNTGSGSVFTFGDNLSSVITGTNSTVQNNGIILSRGNNAPTVVTGSGSSVINNPTGQIAASGIGSNAVTINGDGMVINAGGLIQATGDNSDGVRITGAGDVQNSGRVIAFNGNGLRVGGLATVTNLAGGSISSEGGDAIRLDTNGSTVTNNGLIQTRGDEAIEASDRDNITIINNGTIQALGTADKGIEANANLTIVNTGLIFSEASEAIEADAAGLNLTNSGQIIAPLDDAVDGDDNATIVNTGLIRGGENDAIELNSGTITNSGTIESLSSDPNGSLIIGGVVPELDAGIDFDAGTNGNEDGVVFNLVGGVIVGDIGINASSGNQDSPDTNDGVQTIYNFGTITGRGVNTATGGRTDAVLLGNGDDVFLKLNGGVENGVVDGEMGTDTFAFLISDTTNRSFSLSGIDTQYVGFEDLRFGSQTFDFVNLTTTGAPTASGVITLTGSTARNFTVVNTAILAGTSNGTINYVTGASSGINLGFTIANGGAISTTGNGQLGFVGGDNVVLTNNGSITTTGMNTAGVVIGANGRITNSGAILSEGVNGVAISAGNGTSITNNAGATITTRGTNGFNIVIAGNGTLTNAGVISSSGTIAQAVTISGAGVVSNSGVIAAADGRAIDIGGLGTVTNAMGGTIASGGDDAIRLSTANSTVTNNGSIISAGGQGIAADVNGIRITNAGTINTTGMSTAALLLGTNGVFTNSGAVLAEGVNGVAVAAGNGALITNNAGATITTRGANGFNIVISGNGTINNAGVISSTGTGAQAVTINGTGVISNSGIIASTDGRAVDIAGMATITNAATGTIGSNNNDAIRFNTSGSTLTNNGTIISNGDEAVEADGLNNITVINTGTITAGLNGDKGIEANANLTVTNSGLITSLTSEAIEADAGGLVVTNSGQIIAPLDDAIDGDDNVTITNTGLIQGGENDGLELNSGTITNSGRIESLSSDPDGDFITIGMGTGQREIDAGIDFDGGTDGNENGIVRNNAGGVIIGDIGINTSSGATGAATNDGRQQVINFGTITGRRVNPETGFIDAALLGNGNDEFQQWTGATVNGWINLGAGMDTFILEGTTSSVTGMIDGGAGTDIAILGGIWNSNNLIGFETIQLGSTLGGTLNDLTVTGNRMVNGNVVVVGTVNFNLGVDSIVNNGNLTLASGSTININTPLNQALIGQTVTVIRDNGGVFTNSGGRIVINDDDLLIDYTPILGSVLVQVGAANPVVNNPDPNIAAFGAAVAGGLRNGTLNAANFTALNGLSASGYVAALPDAVPSLSEGFEREVFETATFSSLALDRHIATEGSRLWGQFAVRGATQDALSTTADGYDSDQLIFTAGVDFVVLEGLRIGLLGSYADIDSQDLRADSVPTVATDAQSYKVGLYVAGKVLDRGFINSEFAYLTGSADTARSGFFGPIASQIDFDGFHSRATIGYDLIADENVSFTPTIGFNAARLRFDDAAETGGFGFLVERGDATFAELRGGLDLGAQISETVNGFVSGTVIRDLIDSDRSFRVSSTQLPSFSLALPLREQNRFELSAGLGVDVSENFAINVGYYGDFNEGYQAHSARATVSIGF
jgi:azurin